jgi:hypothetical protein
MNDLTLYNAVKAKMDTGDLLQWRTEGIIGAAIRWRTLSNVNHSSLVLNFSQYAGAECRRFTTEARGHGVGLNMLSARLAYHKGEVWWYPLDTGKCPVKRENIGDRALSYIGHPYDFKSILKLCMGRVSSEASELFCSEYCAICYGATGSALTPAELPSLNIFKEPVRLI